MTPIRLASATIIAAVILAAACSSPTYDLVIANGRVMDPESGLDAVRHVGITGGKIVTISERALKGTRVVDATGLVVAPGFIDLHEHGQNEESYGLMVRDGVTSALEIEVGTGDIANWYAEREKGQIVNYGASIGHIKARMQVLHDPGTALLPAGVGGSGIASDAQQAEMEAILRRGLAEGAVAVGFGSAYTPGANMAEMERMFRVAGGGGANCNRVPVPSRRTGRSPRSRSAARSSSTFAIAFTRGLRRARAPSSPATWPPRRSRRHRPSGRNRSARR